jgi:hypothetical protein
MATLSVQNLAVSGELQPSYAAAAGGGDEMPNDGDTFLHVKNGGGAGITVTIAAQVATRDAEGYGPFTRANLAVSIAAAADKMIGPLPAKTWNNANGRAAITYSGVTTVTVAALRVPRLRT